jgi:hypothetical protein
MKKKEHEADKLLFRVEEEKPTEFRSMVVSDKVLENDNIQENKV